MKKTREPFIPVSVFVPVIGGSPHSEKNYVPIYKKNMAASIYYRKKISDAKQTSYASLDECKEVQPECPCVIL